MITTKATPCTIAQQSSMKIADILTKITELLQYHKSLWLTRPPSKCLEQIRKLWGHFVGCAQQFELYGDPAVVVWYFTEGHFKWDDYERVIRYSHKFSGRATLEKFVEDTDTFIDYYLALFRCIKKVVSEHRTAQRLSETQQTSHYCYLQCVDELIADSISNIEKKKTLTSNSEGL